MGPVPLQAGRPAAERARGRSSSAGTAPGHGRYVVTRDLATYAIPKEVEAGRGSPAGGAWLSFRHVPEAELRAAFGPVIDKLLANGIDLTRQDVEVAPIAHYHMGGIRVDTTMATGVPGLYAAGEAVGGANGANRLSGNAITEALAFGRAAGRSAAATIPGPAFDPAAAAPSLALATAIGPACNTAALFAALQAVMADKVGPFRTAAGLDFALAEIRALARGGRHGAARRTRRARPGAAGLVRPAARIAGGGGDHPLGPGPHRKPRRASAGGFPRHGRSLDPEPDAGTAGRRAAARPPGAGMSAVATLQIRRGVPGEPPRVEEHAVPFEPGQSLLDALRWLRLERDPSLAFRYSCLNANSCKECMMLLDGKVVYACTARLEARPMRVEPLPNKPLLRDLATAIAPPDERLG